MSIVFEIDRKYCGFSYYRSLTSTRIMFAYFAVTYHPFSIYDKIKVDK